MAVKVLTYNTRDGLGDPERFAPIIDFVESENPDVAFFSEAYTEGVEPMLALEALRDLGYTATHHAYDDIDDRQDRHGFIGITRPGSRSLVHSYGSRYGYYAGVRDGASGTTIDTQALHADDRLEATRVLQLTNTIWGQPAHSERILMGDLNSMHADSHIAKVMRLIGPLARHLPTIELDGRPAADYPRLRLFANRLQRLSETALGSALELLEDEGLHDADPNWQPTMPARHPLFQLDHIMYSDGLRVTPGSFVTHHDVRESDHLPISAVLEVVPADEHAK